MAPQCVLLERNVGFVPGRPPVVIEGTNKDEARRAGKQPAVSRPRRAETTMEDRAKAMAANLETMKPDLQVCDPLGINYLSMVQQIRVGLPGGKISSTDKALIVLYAGSYFPGSTSSSSGCYLVYDAASNGSLSAIPQLPDPHTFRGLGRGAAILSVGKESSYVLAELVAATSGFPNAELFLWFSPSRPNQEAGQWIRKAVCLPRQVFSYSYFFQIDMAFAYGNSQVCWVDLLNGILVCNQLESPEPKFTFVPLPEGYSIDADGRELRPQPQAFRTMGCVRGSIKFVALVGDYGSCPEEMMLKTWTLSPDLKEWNEGKSLSVGQLWASSFLGSALPRIAPSFPVISTDGNDNVFLVLNDIATLGVAGVDIEHRAHHLLLLDTVQAKVLSWKKVIPGKMAPLFPHLIATELGAHLQGPKLKDQEML